MPARTGTQCDTARLPPVALTAVCIQQPCHAFACPRLLHFYSSTAFPPLTLVRIFDGARTDLYSRICTCPYHRSVNIYLYRDLGEEATLEQESAMHLIPLQSLFSRHSPLILYSSRPTLRWKTKLGILLQDPQHYSIHSSSLPLPLNEATSIVSHPKVLLILIPRCYPHVFISSTACAQTFPR